MQLNFIRIKNWLLDPFCFLMGANSLYDSNNRYLYQQWDQCSSIPWNSNADMKIPEYHMQCFLFALQAPAKTWRTPWQLSSSEYKPACVRVCVCVCVWNLTGTCTCDCWVWSELCRVKFCSFLSLSQAVRPHQQHFSFKMHHFCYAHNWQLHYSGVFSPLTWRRLETLLVPF